MMLATRANEGPAFTPPPPPSPRAGFDENLNKDAARRQGDNNQRGEQTVQHVTTHVSVRRKEATVDQQPDSRHGKVLGTRRSLKSKTSNNESSQRREGCVAGAETSS